MVSVCISAPTSDSFSTIGWIGFPDELATEELQRRHVNTVALNRVEDVIVDHAVGFAGHEVVHAVGRRGVNHASARAQFDILGQVHRRQTVVERVTEVDQLQRGSPWSWR
jgi:hypothetical protein